jgi:hypothetical protein
MMRFRSFARLARQSSAPKLAITGQQNDAHSLVDEPIYAATLITVRAVPLDDLRTRPLASRQPADPQHGDDTELAAARRANLMLERGDLEGQTLWNRIRRAIVELQAPPTGTEH